VFSKYQYAGLANFLRACDQIVIKFEVLSHAHGNFEEQNQVLECSIIMILFSIIMYNIHIIIILYN